MEELHAVLALHHGREIRVVHALVVVAVALRQLGQVHHEQFLQGVVRALIQTGPFQVSTVSLYLLSVAQRERRIKDAATSLDLSCELVSGIVSGDFLKEIYRNPARYSQNGDVHASVFA